MDGMSRTTRGVRVSRRWGGWWRRLATTLLLVAAAACGGDGGGPAGLSPSIEGHWRGSASLGALQFEATFAQDGEEVTGTGEFSSILGGGDFVASGTLIGGAVELVLTSDELGTATYSARFVARDRITGTLTAPGYGTRELTLDRD
jgi:hypothetical protein